MKRTILAVTLGLAVAGALPVASGADYLVDVEQVTVERHRYETTLVVEALPLEAVVQVDGRPIGTASDLTGKALSVGPGHHTVQITAPGFRPFSSSFFADSLSSVNQFRVVLAPE